MTCVAERKKSTHKVEIVPVTMSKHPNADSLSIIPVFGYTYVGRTEDWAGVTKAAYVPPDSQVDVRRPEFSFLGEQAKEDGLARIKARKLRGIVSYGLMVPVPDDTPLGEDWADRLGVTRYEPPEPGEQREKFIIGGEEEAGPDIHTGPNKYDVDAFERYHTKFEEGEPVYVSEKLDGSNCRFVFWDGRFWVKTRNRWVKRVPDYSHITLDSLVAKGVPEDKAQEIIARIQARKPKVNGFWEQLELTPNLMEYLQANPGTVVFGEVYGTTNRIKYGLRVGNAFSAFDVYREGRFLDVQDMVNELDDAGVPRVPCVPKFYEGTKEFRFPEVEGVPYSFDLVKKLAEGKTTVAGAKQGTIREGVVVRPMKERWDEHIGRVILKCVSPTFLEKAA